MSDVTKPNQNSSETEHLTKGAYSPTTAFADLEKSLKPQAWHRPRKQWVREKQWLDSIAEFIAGGNTNQSGILQYLTLPGPDMLDVRLVGALCKANGHQLKLLGFNDGGSDDDSATEEASEALAPLWMSDLVTRDSWIHPDRFQSLANPQSKGSQSLQQVGALDVINLDLCNSLAAHQESPSDPTHYDAVHTLFDHQRNNRSKPFLVFLTTRADKQKVDPAVFKKLNELLIKNCKNAQFEKALNDAFGINKHKVIGYKEAAKEFSSQDFLRVFLVGLSKWFLGLLLGGSPKWRIDLISACEYSVRKENGREMLSLCYRCEMIKTGSLDGAKLSSKAGTAPKEPTEADIAIDIVRSAAKIFDLDKHITTDALYQQLAERAADVMAQAGYGNTEYLEWCFKPENHPLLSIPKLQKSA